MTFKKLPFSKATNWNNTEFLQLYTYDRAFSSRVTFRNVCTV